MGGTAKRIGIAALLVAGVVLGTATVAGARASAAPKGPAAVKASAVDPSLVPNLPAPTPITRPLVILYGDSLAWEAEDSFVGAFAGQLGVQVLTRTYGGTAICDYLDAMRADAAALAPGAVVIEFSGNALTPCMQDPTGAGLTGDAYWARYRADALTVVDIFATTGTRVFLVGAPISRTQAVTGDFHGGQVNAMYAQTATLRSNVRYVDAGAAVLDRGAWTETLPCLAGEPCTGGTDLAGRGVNVVRAPDGGHFCPAGDEAKRGVTTACPVWSSGAYRYANAMARPVLDAFAV